MFAMDDEQNETKFTPDQSLQVIADMIEKVQNDKLRRLAKKRVAFKQTVAFLSVITLTLLAIWYFTTGLNSYFWPAWAIGLFVFIIAISYLDAYMNASLFSEDKEYEKLKSQNKNLYK